MLTHLVFGGWSAVSVSQVLVASSGSDQSSPGLPPNSAGVAERSHHLGLLAREQVGLETTHDHERGHASSRTHQRVIDILHPWQMGGSGGWETDRHATQGRLQILVDPGW